MAKHKIIVQYDSTVSRDHKGVGMANENVTQNQPHFSLTMVRQYWLGKTEPK